MTAHRASPAAGLADAVLQAQAAVALAPSVTDGLDHAVLALARAGIPAALHAPGRGTVPPGLLERLAAAQETLVPVEGGLAVAVRSEGRVLGALVVAAGPECPGPEGARALASLGETLGLGLLAEEAAQAAARVEAEAEAMRALDSVLVEEPEAARVYDAVAREAALLVGADVTLALVDRDAGLRPVASHGPRAQELLARPDPALLRRLRQGTAGWEDAGGRSVLSVSLRLSGRELAVLVAADGPRPGLPAGPFVRFGAKASQALAHLRAREAESRRMAQLALVSAVAEIAASTLDLPALAGSLARYVQTSFGYYAVTVYLVEPETRETVLTGAAGAAQSAFPHNHRIAFGQGIIGWVAQNGESVLANDVRTEPRFLPSDLTATRSELAVPVRVAGEVVAVINVESTEPGTFDGSDAVALDAIAAQAAAAIRNARLFEEKVRTLRTLEIVQKVTRDLVSELDLDTLLQRIARRSVEAVRPARRGVVLLYDGGVLLVRSSFGYPRPDALARARLEFHEGLPGAVFVSGQGRLAAGAADYGRQGAAFAEARVESAGGGALCVPVSLPEKKLGVLLLESGPEGGAFDPSGLRLASTLADQAAIAVGNALRLARIIEMDRHRQEYLSNVSHELRTPLTVIQGYAETLAATADAPTERPLRVVVDQCERLGRMIDEVLEVSRLEQGVAQRHLQRIPVDFGRLAASVLPPLRAEARVKGVVLAEALLPVPDLEGDPRLLEMLVRNLVENAVKFTLPGGRVDLEVRPGPGEVVLQVRDTGIGIAPEHRERVFEKFFTVDGGVRRAAAGAGIGLYLTREIVAIHGGTLAVESRVGEGSCFEVRLPVSLP